MRLQPLLDSVQANSSFEQPPEGGPRVARHLSCQATQSGLLQASFCIGVTASRERTGAFCLAACRLCTLVLFSVHAVSCEAAMLPFCLHVARHLRLYYCGPT